MTPTTEAGAAPHTDRLVRYRHETREMLAAFIAAKNLRNEIVGCVGTPAEMANRMLLLNERLLRTLYGIGLPTAYVSSRYGGLTRNLTTFLCPHTSVTPKGFTLVEALVSWRASPEAVAKARTLVTAYNVKWNRLVAASPVLMRLWGMLEKGVHVLQEQDMAFVEEILDIQVASQRFRVEIIDGFPDAFYAFVARAESSEAFRDYAAEMERALGGLMVALPAA